MSTPQNQPPPPPLMLDLACGPEKRRPDAIGLDLRLYDCLDIRADVIHLPFTDACADHIFAHSILEHFKNPYPLLEEIYRIMQPHGSVEFIVPNFGTYSSESDPGHLFVTDLAHWRLVLGSFFHDIIVKPFGVKWQSSSHKWFMQQIAWVMDGLYDLAQGFQFICTVKQQPVVYYYVTDYMEDFARERQREFVVPRQARANSPSTIMRMEFSLYTKYLAQHEEKNKEEYEKWSQALLP